MPVKTAMKKKDIKSSLNDCIKKMKRKGNWFAVYYIAKGFRTCPICKKWIRGNKHTHKEAICQ